MRAVWLALFSAVLWGLLWIPIRWLESRGLHGLWAATVMNSGATLAILCWFLARPGAWVRPGARALAGAGIVGVALACYSAALNYSDVVRVVLLFYLAPLWSKIIETLFLGVRWTRQATIALGLGLVGAILILGVGPGSLDLRPGDGLALVSGLAWAAGAAVVFTDRSALTVPMVAISGAAGVFVTVFFLPFESLPATDTASVLAGLLAGAVYILPVMLLTIWTARRLPPTTLTFLLTAEIVVGVASSAWLLDETFGVPQMIGTVLILLAATIEVTASLSERRVG